MLCIGRQAGRERRRGGLENRLKRVVAIQVDPAHQRETGLPEGGDQGGSPELLPGSQRQGQGLAEGAGRQCTER